ncbi:MAG TPA: glycosyltransferase family 10 [Gaiellaceae bacterium]|nr:glycosyltransferase family 10 [Gaiellaceae bacterium]
MSVTTPASATGVKLFIDPLSHHFERDRVFDSGSSPYGGDSILEPYAHTRRVLAEQGIAVHTPDLLESGAVAPGDVNVYVTMGIRDRYRRLRSRPDVVMSAFFVPECPIAEPRLYRDLADAASCFKRMYSFSTGNALRPFLTQPIEFEPFRFPQAFDHVHESVWAQRERAFMTIINANKLPRLSTNELYSERMRAVEFFARYDEIDLYGIGWDGPPFRLGTTRVPAHARRVAYLAERRWRTLVPDRDPLRVAARKAWRGAVASKAATLGGYTFAICFENMILEGWITEKVFDCFYAGTVPIYLGAPDVEQWIPRDCYVDMRDFADYGELRAYLHGLSPAAVDGYREAARAFLGSDAFYPFSKDAFAARFAEIVAEDAGVRV